MPAYIVRILDTRDLVGFFFAEDDDELATVVDECTDVPDCEYAELPTGGVIWTSPAIAVPIETDDGEGDGGDVEDGNVPEVPWSKASLTDGWWNVAYKYTELLWVRFEPEDPLNPPPPAPRRPMEPGRVVPMRRR